MNFKTQAEKLAVLLEEELKKIPLVVLSDKLLAYKKYKIKQNKQGLWLLISPNGDLIEKFRIKTTASLAAKFYDKTNLKKFNEVKILDSQFWSNSTDAMIFDYRYRNSKDPDRKDLFISRLEIAKTRASHYKQEISSLFKANF